MLREFSLIYGFFVRIRFSYQGIIELGENYHNLVPSIVSSMAHIFQLEKCRNWGNTDVVVVLLVLVEQKTKPYSERNITEKETVIYIFMSFIFYKMSKFEIEL